MKRIQIAILILLIPLCCVAFAALVKTTSIVELDPWGYIAAGTLDVGAAGDISDSYSTLLVVEIVYADDDTQDGVEVSIEVSYADDDWTLLTGTPFTTETDNNGATSTLDGAVSATDTVISLIAGGNFNVNGQKWFILDGTDVTDSESVRTKSAAGNDITICHDTVANHNTGSTVWNIVQERIIPIPAAFAFVRVLINNTDADADIYYTTRLLKVTGL